MKNQVFATLAVIIVLTACYVNVGNASPQASVTFQSSGTITQGNSVAPTDKPEFLLRFLWIGSQTTAVQVDAYVAAHPWGTGIILTDGSNGILNILSYTGWSASATWVEGANSITYAQLKTVIDEYHRLGWKVVYSAGNTPTQSGDSYIYNYLTTQHPELIAVSGNGSNYAQLYPGSVMINFFANYATPDPARNIAVGEGVDQLYVSRLNQMISDGSFQWDGWFGVDGWNGFTQQGMYWNGLNPVNWYYGDAQSINEWGNSSYGEVPSGTVQSVVGTLGNSALNLNNRFAMTPSTMYANRFQCSNSGNVTSISVHTDATVLCQVFVYSDNSGSPNTLIGYGVGTTTNGAYASITLTEQATVTSGSYYWLIVEPSTSLNIFYNPSISSIQSAEASNTYGNYPSSFPSPTYGTLDMNIYATVTQSSTWSAMSTVQKSSWIIGTANLQWWEYWQMRFAQFYAQINAVFVQRGSDDIGGIISQDLSSTYDSSGPNNVVGMENLTMFAQYDSFNNYYVDCEWGGSTMGQYQAYVAGLVATKEPSLHLVAGIEPYSLESAEQQYLAQIQTYVWYDGVQSRAVDSDFVIIWSGTQPSDGSGLQPFCTWATSVANVLNNNITPTWLGPVDILAPSFSGQGQVATAVNVTFAQFADSENLVNNPQYIKSGMGTICLDSNQNLDLPAMTGLYSTILSMYAQGTLNVFYNSYGYGDSLGGYFGGGESQCDAAFGLSTPSNGVSNSYTVLNPSDPYAQAIVSGYQGTNISSSNYDGTYQRGSNALVPIVDFTDNYVALGITYNATSSRFLYGREISADSWTYNPTIPAEIVNRGIYWVSQCPITTSESLVDLKIFTLSNGNIAIPMMNMANGSGNLQTTLSINTTALGLTQPAQDYSTYWASNPSTTYPLNSAGQVSVTLHGGADILIISS